MTIVNHAALWKVYAALLCLGLLTVQAKPANSDELYEFWSINCLPELHTLKVDAFRLWNVGFYVWQRAPRSDDSDHDSWERANRAQHVENLRRLEEAHGVYVVGESYGRWDDRPIDCLIGGNMVRVSFEKREMEGNTGEGIRAYRDPATINIVNKDGKVVWRHSLHSEHATFQVNSNSILYVPCDNGQFCDPQNYQSANFAP